MSLPSSQQLRDICKAWLLPPEKISIKQLGQGHINDTLLLHEPDGHWVLQKINQSVFPDPFAVQHNFEQVCQHLASVDYPLEAQSARLTADGASLLVSDTSHWRMLGFIDGCYSLENTDNQAQAYEAALGFGLFDLALKNLPPEDLKQVLPDFHNPQARAKDLNEAIQRDSMSRVSKCRQLIQRLSEFTFLQDWYLSAIASQSIELRVTHNDTKINNILLDRQSHRARAVVDWDTIMPGYWCLDFGDMVRSFTPQVDEDGGVLSGVEVRWPILQATAEGFLEACGDNLAASEKAHLLTAAKLIVYMLGMRFLTDYLNGDVYFKTRHPEHNLERCKTQLALLDCIHKQSDEWVRRLGLLK